MRTFELNEDSLKSLNDTVGALDSLASGAGSEVFGIKDREHLPYRKPKYTKVEHVEAERLSYRPEEKHTQTQGWQTILLLFTLFLVGFVRAFNTNRIVQSIRALFNYVVAQEIVREEKVFFHRSNLVLILVHLINTSLFIHFVIINVAGYAEIRGIRLFGMVFGFMGLIYLVKYIFAQVLFFVLNGTSLAIEYVFNVCLFNNLMGVLLLPVLAIAFFTSIDFNALASYVAFPLIAMILVFRILRLVVIGKENSVSYLYIFLYICTLEILPLVVLYRIFILD